METREVLYAHAVSFIDTWTWAEVRLQLVTSLSKLSKSKQTPVCCTREVRIWTRAARETALAFINRQIDVG